MLEMLARNWRWVLFRAIITALYGVAALAWPSGSWTGFVFLFGVYAVADGMIALAIAIDVRGLLGFGGLVFEAFVRIAGGLVATGSPAVVLAFPQFLAVWAILAGAADGFVAAVLRRELEGEWPLPLAGAVSIVIAVLLLLTPGAMGVTALRWVVGPYAIMLATTLLALARRLRQLAAEIGA